MKDWMVLSLVKSLIVVGYLVVLASHLSRQFVGKIKDLFSPGRL